MGCEGSLVERVRVSVYGMAEFEPFGGAHLTDTSAGEPCMRPERGSPELIENQDPTANDPDCEALRVPTPLFRIEIDFNAVDVTHPKAIVEEGAGVGMNTGAAEHVSE